MRRLVRASLATGGDPVERAFATAKHVPRKLVVLCDISGSMEAYSRALVLFLHASSAPGRGVEAFAFGTRLTRLTPDLAAATPSARSSEAAKRVVDWSGGTRIGASLKAFNDEWGRRALTRGAVVVIVSDGWEREDAALVGREMARLARAAYAVVWVNPLKGNPDYQPLAAGMRAALPFVDRFCPGTTSRASKSSARCWPASKGGMRHEGDPGRRRALAGDGEKVVVATVVATRRSAPRPVGAKLAVSESAKMAARSPAAASSRTCTSTRGRCSRRASRSSSRYGIADEGPGRSACRAAARSTCSSRVVE